MYQHVLANSTWQVTQQLSSESRRVPNITMVIKLAMLLGSGSALGTLVGQETPTAKLMGEREGEMERERERIRNKYKINLPLKITQDEPAVPNSRTLGRRLLMRQKQKERKEYSQQARSTVGRKIHFKLQKMRIFKEMKKGIKSINKNKK